MTTTPDLTPDDSTSAVAASVAAAVMRGDLAPDETGTLRPTVNAELLVHWTSYYTDAAAKLVRHYRDMADRLERELRPDDKASMSGTPRYSHAVEGALEALVWDQANAHAAHLIGAAARADAAEAAVAAEQAAANPTPHDCESCGTSINDCDDRIHGGRTACCSQCGTVDTHGDTPSAYTERLAARGIR
jgi:hypothetical protein